MYGGGFYRMDSSAPRPYYGYNNQIMPQQQNYNQGRGMVGGQNGWGSPPPQQQQQHGGPAVSPASASPVGLPPQLNGGGRGCGRGGGAAAHHPVAGVFTEHQNHLPQGFAVQNVHQRQMMNAGAQGAPGQLGRVPSFVNGAGAHHTGGGGGGAAGAVPRSSSFGNFGSAFGSFHQNGPGAYPHHPAGGNGNMSVYSAHQQQQQLQRANSGVGFGYSFGSFAARSATGPGANGNSSATASNTSLMDMPGANGNGLRKNSSYDFGSFANGVPGIGPGASMTSVGSFGGPGPGAAPSDEEGDIFNLQRQDSQNALQRHYSIAGQFFNFGGPAHPGMGGMAPPPPGGVRPGFTLNGHSGGVRAQVNPAMAQAMQQQAQMQRRLADGKDQVEEGQPTALGRKNSLGNILDRKNTDGRVGMYFRNKEATQEDVDYKKDGDPGTTKTASSKSRDATLVNSVKPILLFDASDVAQPGMEIEFDGNTVRAVKPGQDEIQKYDLQEVVFVQVDEDVEVAGSGLDEIRDQFCMGANVGMMLADADCPALNPTRWFTWTALKSVMKSSFAKIDGYRVATINAEYRPTFEVTVSVCVLQDDQMLDLLGDDSDFDRGRYHLDSLVVAESPLFGNVPNNAVFVMIDNAEEFNDTLDACLESTRGFFKHQRATDNNTDLDGAEEYGIVLVTCVLKQTRKSASTGKKDVLVSSIFASGVGSGTIHYNRIMDKNPAEPRALFYSVLHRSCLSTAIMSLKQSSPEVLSTLNTLKRFSEMGLRKPKIGSMRHFLYYAENTVPKIKTDLEKMKEGRQKLQTQRFLEKLELMAADMEVMLEDPEGCVPKTYI